MYGHANRPPTHRVMGIENLGSLDFFDRENHAVFRDECWHDGIIGA